VQASNDAAEAGKNRPLEPLSMKLAGSGSTWPLAGSIVVKLSNDPISNTVALPRVLFDCVPIPKISDPSSVAAGLASAANDSAVPLLSEANNTVGLVT